jgi:ADP-ribose pyrophosphatase YjhB (NUDIX family)
MIAAGALFYAKNTERFLFLHRTQGRKPQVWGIVGGSQESGETVWKCCKREIAEEIGSVEIEKIVPLECFKSHNQHFEYFTYICVVKSEFVPVLNCEHNGYAWVNYGIWPKPLHYGLYNTLKKETNQAKIKTVIKLI